ncbi:Phenylacetic acid degradation-related protein [Roseovarius sp. EC-HK134]|uniref:PaaI family thioesterase n=1 Tax=Roseovarius TaxID=74030 RepID=UPI001254277C|nr:MULTISPECIES: PaaI family thioesterase [unclassified Roseovarius]VVT06856.1 Phenylacetic acid degradation-related protein [Roseovarius sp. EC-HK134]VVT07621.1 Phenylacetic acid degradation-related protein [Roseovarius sp. EC-SD190]
MSPDIEQKIRRSFAAQAMMTTLGARLVALSDGATVIEAPILPGSRQQHGFGHAGLTFAIGDSAAGYAALSLMADGAEVLTTEMKINLLAPAQGERLIARGRVIKPGRRLVIVQADVYALQDGVETHIALLTGTMIPV